MKFVFPELRQKACPTPGFVEPTGLEPMTSRTSSGRSSQLSYGSIRLLFAANKSHYK